MRFQRFGHCRHLWIKTAEDLARVLDLDEALWVATGAPIDTISCDPTFLDLVDTDHNGRILCFEMRQAVRWLLDSLRDTSGVTEASDSLRLDAVNTEPRDGRRIRDSAEKMLARLGRAGSAEITLADVRRIKAEVSAAPVSEAGVVLPAAAEDEKVAGFLADILATLGGADHPSEAKGVDRAHLERFLAEAQAYLDWRAQGNIPAGKTTTAVMPLGAKTSEAFEICADLAPKIDQYFARCEAVAFDARLAERAGIDEEKIRALDLADPQALDRFLQEAPLAAPRPDGVLEFEKDVNPRYADRLAAFRQSVVTPVLGRRVTRFTRRQWDRIREFFAAHKAWAAARPARAVECLGAERLQEYLAGEYRTAAESLIAQRAAAALELGDIRLTEKLILYQVNLLSLANNFVSFPDLYDPRRRAMFEMGTLIMDGRRLHFAVKVADRARHGGIARTGNMYVLYAEVLDAEGKARYELAVPVTSGSRGNLCVGKRGVFQDVLGAEHDARVAEIIENPISLREALVSPFRRVGRTVSGKIEALATSAEKKLDATVSAAAQPAAAPAPAPQGRGMLVGGLLVGGSAAIAALGAAAAYVSKTLADVPPHKVVLTVVGAIVGVIVVVMLPTSIVSLMKLRRRDLSAILEGSGWAINARMRLTVKQGRSFTQRPSASRWSRWRWLLWLIVVGVLAAIIAYAVWVAPKPVP